VKLGKYDGSTCLPTFLAKFENCSQYYSWDEKDRLFQFRASLEGPAGQILWEASQSSRVKDIILLLRARFNTNTNTNDNVYGAVIMARPLREFTRFI